MTRVPIWGPPHLGVPHPAELRAVVEEVLPDLKKEGVRVFYLSSASPTPGVEALLPSIEAASDEPIPDQHRANTAHNSKALYIYTSGTTGEPLGGGGSPHLGVFFRAWVLWVRAGAPGGSWGDEEGF